MGTPKASKASTDRLAWQKIFKALVQMTQTQQAQLESLAKERKFLEKRIKLQHERWVSDVKLFKDRISEFLGFGLNLAENRKLANLIRERQVMPPMPFKEPMAFYVFSEGIGYPTEMEFVRQIYFPYSR